MRLLHTTELRLQSFEEESKPKYAILSHTWDQQELSFQNISSRNFTHLPGYQKVKRSCDAIKDKYEWIWIDTCSIDKSSSGELSQAINSMYRWYEESDMCYVYLGDFTGPKCSTKDSNGDLEALRNCRWFTRGWTLQELIAPTRVLFWDRDWKEIGNKLSLHSLLSSITGIPSDVLSMARPPRDCNIGQRMSWASSRVTTRSEDIAYCLLGLFDIHIIPVYGEGQIKAFLRLQEEILRRWSDHSIFIWSTIHEPRNIGLLASSPKAFCKHEECFSWLGQDLPSLCDPFDPYAWMTPLEPSPSLVDALPDGRVSTLPFLTEGGIGIRNLPTPSLGPQGLHLSLLADEGLEDSKHDRPPLSILRKKWYVCFDLSYRGRRGRSNILLSLYLDIPRGFDSHDISRRGHLTRGPSVAISGGTYELRGNCKRYRRQTLCFSQLEPYATPENESLFIFKSFPATATVTGVMADFKDPEISQEPLNVNNLISGITCFGGSVALKHDYHSGSGINCTCVPFLIHFGTHGLQYKAWCCVSPGKLLGLEETELTSPSLSRFRIIERSSSRYKSGARRQLPPIHCGHWVRVSMSPIIQYDRPSSPAYEVRVAICEDEYDEDLQFEMVFVEATI